VKLRPARPEEARTLAEQRTPPPSSRLSDTPEDFEISFIDTCPRPFRGFTICTTGIDRVRRELFAHALALISLARRRRQSTILPKAGEMGANTTAAFTDYVTHLIADEHGGAKYWVRYLGGSSPQH
jgi:DNA replication regulator DPB11